MAVIITLIALLVTGAVMGEDLQQCQDDVLSCQQTLGNMTRSFQPSAGIPPLCRAIDTWLNCIEPVAVRCPTLSSQLSQMVQTMQQTYYSGPPYNCVRQNTTTPEVVEPSAGLRQCARNIMLCNANLPSPGNTIPIEQMCGIAIQWQSCIQRTIAQCPPLPSMAQQALQRAGEFFNSEPYNCALRTTTTPGTNEVESTEPEQTTEAAEITEAETTTEAGPVCDTSGILVCAAPLGRTIQRLRRLGYLPSDLDICALAQGLENCLAPLTTGCDQIVRAGLAASIRRLKRLQNCP